MPSSQTISLLDELPSFAECVSNRITWYQYLVFVTTSRTPFYVTYPAEWCWDIEGQSLKFREHFAIDPSEAARVDSRFYISDPDEKRFRHNMIGDLINMKVIDSTTKHEYEFKSTPKLIGTLIHYGQILFERYYDATTREIFLYDQKTGYDQGSSESTIKIGDRVVFEVWWNRDENESYYFDIAQRLQSHNDGIHFDMFAFNVKLAQGEEEAELTGANKVSPVTPSPFTIPPFAAQPKAGIAPYVVSDEFGDQRFNGLIISLKASDNTGYMVCYPYKDELNKHLTLRFDTQSINALGINMCVEFVICVNPVNCEYVAMNIVANGKCNEALLPITSVPVQSQCTGRIVVIPESIYRHGWIYNEFDHTMTVLLQSECSANYKIGDYVMYNEKQYNGSKDRELFNVVSSDIKQFEKVGRDIVKSYCNDQGYVKFNAERYVSRKELQKFGDYVEYKNVPLQGGDFTQNADIFLIVETINTFFNNHKGGAILFGITEHGHVVGQRCMTKQKRQYIENEIYHRVSQFKEYCSIKFKPVVEENGYVEADTFVIIVKSASDDSYSVASDSVPMVIAEKEVEEVDKEIKGDYSYTPPNTEYGRLELAKRVEESINRMMMVEEFMLDHRWETILCIASSPHYNAQKTSLILMRELEKERRCRKPKPRPIEIEPEPEPEPYTTKTNFNGLPILKDKSKYKAVATEYCQKMGWNQPTEEAQYIDKRYVAEVSFGKVDNEISAKGKGLRRKEAIYNAYVKLIALVIPKDIAYKSIVRFMPGYKKGLQKLTPNGTVKHPKSILCEWATKNDFAQPHTKYTELIGQWSAEVTFCEKTVEAKGTKKKDAESKCFEELLKHYETLKKENNSFFHVAYDQKIMC